MTIHTHIEKDTKIAQHIWFSYEMSVLNAKLIVAWYREEIIESP